MTNLELEKLIERYNITPYEGGKIRVGSPDLAGKENKLDTIRDSKALILDYFHEKKRAYEEREIKIKAIEGLEEIEKCRADWREWHIAFNKMVDTGSSKMNVSAPKVDEKELREQYPRANAYLIAYANANKSNYEISTIGRNALERIINGEDYKKVLNDMNENLQKLTAEHFWD